MPAIDSIILKPVPFIFDNIIEYSNDQKNNGGNIFNALFLKKQTNDSDLLIIVAPETMKNIGTQNLVIAEYAIAETQPCSLIL
ncbi:hypothetical protein AN695_0224915 [Serratia marcescens]|uniref:Uncharacterized protein n=1 Tax=Serratia marcescens TaxID=615 RepID=A0A6H2ZSS1_SERMA|nr:hypothetical protein AN695_0224915 [Serratia marcescens]